MSPEIAYFLKVNIALALFYAFYRLFLYKDTFFRWRRTALLCFLAISVFYPLLNIQEWVKEQEPMVIMADIYSTVILPEITVETTPGTDWKQLFASSLNYLYIGVLCLLCLRFLVQLFGIIKVRMQTPTMLLKDTRIHLLDKPQGPFSFFKWIFIHPQAHTEEELEEILTHEKTHARQWHSIDVIISEFVCILCWFNPFVWLLKREIRNNLEFMADHKVLETGHDCKTYQYHLLGLTYEKKVATLYNSFNVLPLKIRIRMMNKKRTKRIGRTKYLIFLPLAALLLIVSNIEAIARSTEKFIDSVNEAASAPDSQQQDKKFRYKGVVVDKNGKPINDIVIGIEEPNAPVVQSKNGEFSFEWKESFKLVLAYSTGEAMLVQRVDMNSNRSDRENLRLTFDQSTAHSVHTIPQISSDPSDLGVVFEVVEKMPEYPGGSGALMKFLQDNIKYPESAVKNNIQGRVIVQFIVDKEGNIIEPSVVRSVSPELDNEAIYVVKAMPKWIPGTQRGEKVAVRYTVPVMFRLPDKEGTNIARGYDETVVNGEVTYGLADNMPEFPGGVKALMDYIGKNIKYPADAISQKTQGVVMVQFVVYKDGNIKDPRIVRGVSTPLDQEAIRIVNNMPKWKPGKIKGEDVSVKYTLPIKFDLEKTNTTK